MMKEMVLSALRNLAKRKAYKFFIKDWVSLTDLQRCSDVMGTMRHSQNLEPLLMAGPKAKRILVLSPHHDDEIIGPGGTIIKELEAGSDVFVLYFTAGTEKAEPDLKRESLKVSRYLGFQTDCLGYLPKAIPLDDSIISAVLERVKEFDPGALLLPFMCDDHDDHRRISQILYKMWEFAPLREGMPVWAYQVYTCLLPNVVIDITEVMEKKRKAIAMYESQMAKRDWVHYTAGLNAYNSRFLPGETRPRFVETFFVLPLHEYVRLCSIFFGRDDSKVYYSGHYRAVDHGSAARN